MLRPPAPEQANEIMAKHQIVSDLCHYWTSDGKSAAEHLDLRIYTLEEFAKVSPKAV